MLVTLAFGAGLNPLDGCRNFTLGFEQHKPHEPTPVINQ
jgi:hypothetical protein